VRIYFDTNIYSYIREKGGMDEVLRALTDFNCTVVASEGNLLAGQDRLARTIR